MQWLVRNLLLCAILGTVAVALLACPNSNTGETPSITATNQTNQTGGTIQVIGSGFTPNNAVSVSILNVPGIAKPWSEKAGVAMGSGADGKINVTITYSYDATSQPPLPGCQIAGNAPNRLAMLNVTAADTVTNVFATTQVQVANCAWVLPQVTSHQ